MNPSHYQVEPSHRPPRTRRRWFAFAAILALAPVLAAPAAYGQEVLEGSTDLDTVEIRNEIQKQTEVETSDQGSKNLFTAKWWKELRDKLYKAASAALFKQALGYFLKRIAVDTATYLASGGKGQKQLFETEGWGAYLTRVADSAGGHFIQSFAEGAGFPNLCQPRFDLKIRLTLGLLQAARPEEPACTFSQAVDSWKDFVNNPPRLNQIIQASFEPHDNDLGIGIGVWSNFYTRQAEEHEGKLLSRLEGWGFKPVTNFAGDIISPGSLIKDEVGKRLDPALLGQRELTYAGESVADAIDAFTNTLVAKVSQRIFEKGFGLLQPERFDWRKLEGLRSFSADPTVVQRTDVRQDFETFFSAPVRVGDPRLNRVEVTAQLLADGVISPQFKSAIDQKLTVRRALDQGLLYGDGPGATFGYTRTGTQPDVNDGYAYDATVILRKYRILPVGWELAAAYIGQLQQKRVYSLNDIIRGFPDPDSPFYRLVDDSWVLKAPETYCRLTGPSDRLALSQVREETIVQRNKPPDPVTHEQPSYQFQRRVVSRQNSCVDTRACILEDDQGNCRAYGLCTQERPIWRFNGTACPAQFDSCTNFEDAAGRTTNYLATTLDAGSCGADAVGCQWYCRDYNVSSNVWTCLDQSERVRKPCQQVGRCSITGTTACTRNGDCPRGETCAGASCQATDAATGVSCQIPHGAVACTVPSCGAGESFVANGGFEQVSASLAPTTGLITFAANWHTSDVAGGAALWQRASGVGNQTSAGSFAARVDADGTRSRLLAESDPLSNAMPGNLSYTLSARLYSTLQFGRAAVSVVTAGGTTACATDDSSVVKGEWVTVHCQTSEALAGARLRLEVAVVAGVNPVGTVWFDEVRLERACPVADVTVYLPGDEERDGSKIFFDRDVNTCSAEENGCRALLPTKTAGGNLLPNSSFEEWSGDGSQLPPGWTNNGGTVARQTDNAAVGTNFVHFVDSNVNLDDVSAGPLGLVTADRTYQVSLYAKADSANNNWKVFFDGVNAAGNPVRQELILNGVGKCTGDSTKSCRRAADCRQPALAADAGDCSSPLPLTASWQRFVFEPMTLGVGLTNFRLTLGSDRSGAIIDLDGAQIIPVPPRSAPAAIAYADYADNPVSYFKTPPAYLGCTGDPQKDHAACSRYAGVCRADEVGCERYTPVNGDSPLPAITTTGDACPAACVDYSAFSQTATFFSEAQPNPGQPDFLYFIARTGKTCEAQNAGCSEFTNLDEVAAGGEGKGSYTYLRQCTKPDATVCRTYYTWVGSDVSGYQLKTYNLRDGDRDGTPDTVRIPNEANLGPCATRENAIANPNCRELLDADGNVHYRLLRETIACAEDCHPFRLLDSTQTACEGSGGYWGVCGADANNNGQVDAGETITGCVGRGGMQLVGGSECFMTEATCTALRAAVNPVLNSVYTVRDDCIYQAIPGESQSCPAAQSGCREYRGNTGGNVRTVFSDDFEDGSADGWDNGAISSDAVTVGGHSLSGSSIGTLVIATPGNAACNTLTPCVNPGDTNCFASASDTCVLSNTNGQRCTARGADTACGTLGPLLRTGRTYQLTFWAKSATGVAFVDARLPGVNCGQSDPALPCNLVTDGRLTTEWGAFTSQPFTVQTVAPNAHLALGVCQSPGDACTARTAAFDFISIKQVQQYHYLVKNSWRTPAVCDSNPALDPQRFPAPNAPRFMLGCREYASSNGQTARLKSFAKLCRDSSVGCQEFIDTQNSTSPFAETFNAGQAQAEAVVPADTLAYYVVGENAGCTAAAKGCAAVGKPTISAAGAVRGYQTVHFLNDPERYGTALCSQTQVGCQEYTSEQQGTVYFRAPESRACEYRQIRGGSDFAWFTVGSSSAVPDCPVIATALGQPRPGKTCQGGDVAGVACSSDADCSFKVCRGGTDEGKRCATPTDCAGPAGVPRCELSAGLCRPWAGTCPAEYASCTAYIDPTSDAQVSVVPNSGFEGYFRVCGHDGQTVCQFNSECAAADPGVKRCVNDPSKVCTAPADCGGSPCEPSSCSITKVNSWTVPAGSPAQHERQSGANRGSALRVTGSVEPICLGGVRAGQACGSPPNCPHGACSGDRSVRQSVSLEGGTLYTVSARVKATARDAAIVLTTVGGSNRAVFANFDHSVAIARAGVLSGSGDTVTMPVGGAGDAAFRRFTGRFVVTNPDRQVTIKISQPGLYDDVEVKPTSAYTYLASSIGRGACNGIYDPAQGCILVNDTSDPALRYSTGVSASGKPPQACLPQQCVGGPRGGQACERDPDCGAGGVCQPGSCDANLLVKVAPDRTCAKWLECISSRNQVNYQTGERQSFCQQLASCDRLDPVSGRCNSFPTEEAQPLQFDAGSVEQVSSYTGYAKVGFTWDPTTLVQGYYPYGAMTQRKVCVAGAVGGACLEDADCNSPEKRDGVCQPVLQVGPNAEKDLVYESCRLYPRSDSPRWGATGPVDTGENPAKSIIVDVNDPLRDPKSDRLLSVQELSDVSECRYLQGRSELAGMYGYCVERDPRSPYLCLNWLPVDDLTGGFTGISGWRDNLPKPLYMCSESATLETRRPTPFRVTECYRTDFEAWGYLLLAGFIAETAANHVEVSSYRCGGMSCPPGYLPSIDENDCGTFVRPGLHCAWTCTPDQSDLFWTDANGVKWYDYKARVDKDDRPTKKHLMYCPECTGDGRVIWNPEDPSTAIGLTQDEQRNAPRAWARACNRLVQVVADDGVNRGWQERLETQPEFQAADYLVPSLNYRREALEPPFGAISRDYVGDPTKFPLIFEKIEASTYVNPVFPTYPGGKTGQIYFDKFYDLWLKAEGRLPNDTVPVTSFLGGRERIKRLFTQSFGDYRWNGRSYERFTVGDKICVEGPLDGQSCADNTQCADSYQRAPSSCVKTEGFCSYSAATGGTRDAPQLSCTNDVECVTKPICATGSCRSDDGNDLNDSGQPCDATRACPGVETCSNTVRIYGRCSGGAGYPPRLNGIACFNDRMCNTKPDGTGIGTCVELNTGGFCSAGINQGKFCAADSACQPPEQVATCVGRCSAGSAVANGRCATDAACQISGTCKETSAWTPPGNQCPGNVRPSGQFTEDPVNDPAGKGDWCGASPEILNVKLENTETPIFYAVSQASVTVSFNVRADTNQLPLRILRVKWDMNNRDLQTSEHTWPSGFRDKPDPRDPFQFTHTYRYDQNCDTGATDGNNATPPDEYCEFAIGILTQDNWCWCSSGKFANVDITNGACQPCPDDAWVKPQNAKVRICNDTDRGRSLCGIP